MSLPPPFTNDPWTSLAVGWKALAEERRRWWFPGLATDAAPTAELPRWLPAYEAQKVAALNARFAPRVQALWSMQNGAAASGSPEAATTDRRFAAPAWREQPFFALIKNAYLLYSEYLTELAELAQLPPADMHRLRFATRHYLDAIAPSNFPATNPEVLQCAFETEGKSLVTGLSNLLDDTRKGRISMSDESAFEVGRDLANTAGSVVYRNELIELIQYDATTPTVGERPLVMVPPCINKYYILDLKPENSLVRHVVAEGHTTFMISWRNVPPELGHLTWDDYLDRGVLAAIRAARDITGSEKVNTLGFCVGGTLLACALAVLAARRESLVDSVTFLTTMLDFANPGEIGVYVSREFLAAREASLLAGQRVHGAELASAFASLRANDLVWHYVVNNYLKGQSPPAFDLLYWNGDSANLPGPMYVYYLKSMYLDNRLREPNALTMLGERIDLSKITIPAYVLATREDHIVPWHSAYRTLALLGGDTTFALGASGHIAGVVNPPSPARRSYWIHDAPATDADAWFERAQNHPGSWWPHWVAWLARCAGAQRPAPAGTGNDQYPPLEPAPGTYVKAPAG